MTFSDLLKVYVDKFKGTASIGYTDSKGECVVKAEKFYEHVRKAEYFFREKIGAKNERIGIVGENSYSYLVTLFGIICSENIAVPLNHTYSDDMLCELFERTRISELICDEDYAESLLDRNLTVNISLMQENFDNILAWSGEQNCVSTANEKDVILMLLSSGTSGVSKIVEITNENLCTFPNRVLEWEKGKAKSSLLLLPFYHISGIIPLLEDMMSGNLTYISNAKYLIRDINNYTIDKLVLVPAMMKRVLMQCEKSGEFKVSCSNVKEALCLGAPMEDSLIELMNEYSIVPKTYYGMTETTGTVSGEGTYKKGACGKISPFCEVVIKDGEVLVKGKNVMNRYFDDEKETAKVLENGWLHTGDLGEIDEEGYLFIRGRKKNIIILSNGENVCPEELENMMSRCEYIQECRVFGEDDAIKTEVFCGKHNDDVIKSVKEYVKNINRSLPPSHKIKDVLFRETPIEKNSMGKIIR